MPTIAIAAPGLRANNPKAVRAVFKVAWWLHNTEGFGFTIPPPRYAPRLDQCAAYVDDGDLFLFNTWCAPIRTEVKWRPDLSFTNAESYRFSTVWFTNAPALERAGDSVAAYFAVNQAMTHAAIIDQRSRPAWNMTSAFMANSQKVEKVWEIDKNLVRFVSIEVA